MEPGIHADTAWTDFSATQAIVPRPKRAMGSRWIAESFR